MVRLVLAAVAPIALAACVTPPSAFPCDTSDQCNPGGTCEPTGFCSFADATCASGRRYGDAAGALSGLCVGDEPGPDAPPATCNHDGVVDTGEQCDDGDMDDTDACVDCQWARCGDNAIRAGVEDCDDGNTADGDACGSSCITCGGDASVVWPVNGHCYMRVDGAVDWDDAAIACDALGGYLASFGSAEEETFVAAALGNNTTLWIGLDDNQIEGQFHWQDDVQLGVGSTYTNWMAGDPDGGVADNCVDLNASGSWTDSDCADTAGFLCERNTWVVDPATHHAYFHVSGDVAAEDYASAVTACTARTGHLVSITSMEEQVVVDAITAATSVWIGLNDIAAEGTYVWESGDPFGFEAWSVPSAEPDGAIDPTQDCGSLRDDGWYDGGCAATRGYICELVP